eukprot:CAMPEP_0194562686 /NCGR_PEP_ID=MMETSP0292-20121207/3041_1 /TAXON_ID=39354 /ORGANISM="Heterosigma akashiwo, Strain CCMP2393" /LENGTH=86 /DNA_ID=CAMNT_0039411463 /DNA_START=950 /DNA_END=1206 /DNA_ORIENTATION=+
MDVRGTGASFGHRAYDLCPEERGDFQEVLAWVRAQPWCDARRVATGGISYDAMAGLQLAAGAPRGHVAALAWLFAPLDAYGDLLRP